MRKKQFAFASRVDVISVSQGLLYRTHSGQAARMVEARQARLHPSVEKKLRKGGSAHVSQIYLLDLAPRSVKSRSQNSSKTTYVQNFVTNRFSDRGLPGRGSVLVSIQQHKFISSEVANLYGLRAGVKE